MSNDSDIADLYRRIVENAPRGALLVELGVWTGTSLARMAGYAKKVYRDDLRIVGVDTWRGSDGEPDLLAEAKERDIFGECVDRLDQAGVLDRVALLRCDSVRAADLFANDSVHFVFHDSCHEREHVYEEVKTWYAKMAAGGVQAGHDVGRTGVSVAVDAFFGDKAQRENSCWWVQR